MPRSASVLALSSIGPRIVLGPISCPRSIRRRRPRSVRGRRVLVRPRTLRALTDAVSCPSDISADMPASLCMEMSACDVTGRRILSRIEPPQAGRGCASRISADSSSSQKSSDPPATGDTLGLGGGGSSMVMWMRCRRVGSPVWIGGGGWIGSGGGRHALKQEIERAAWRGSAEVHHVSGASSRPRGRTCWCRNRSRARAGPASRNEGCLGAVSQAWPRSPLSFE
jgi:hypothetical protein